MFEYDGNPEKFLAWLRAVESIFDYEDYDDRKRCKLAVHQFTGCAYLWYEKLKTIRRRGGKEKIQSWEKLKRYMKRKFLPTDYEQERLFLDTRDPPKPSMIQKDDPCEKALAIIEKLIKLVEERQVAQKAAMNQQQQAELVHESNSTSNVSQTKDASHGQEEQQTMAEIPHLARVKSRTKYQGEAIQEEPKQPMVLNEKTDVFELPIEVKGVDEEDMIQEEFKEPKLEEECPLIASMLPTTLNKGKETQEDNVQAATSMTKEKEEEEGPREATLTRLDDLNLQHLQQNLRANSFQEGEIDAGARGPKHKAKNRQQTKRKKANLEDLEAFKDVRESKNIILQEPTNNLNKLKYQDPP